MARLLAVLLVVAAAGPARAEPGVGDRLLAHFGGAAGYRAVRADVLDWHKTTRNGCVAFVSTALRQVGVPVPSRSYVSRITADFSRWLERQGWRRIADPAQLRPGDLVFTTDAECCPGYPAHVFLVHSWVSRAGLVVRAVDNQRRAYRRALRPGPGDPASPFAYGLRAP